MEKTKAMLSQSQVMVFCGSVDEATKLFNAVQTYAVDEIDDVLRAYPAFKLEFDALQADRLKLLERVAELETKLTPPKKADGKPVKEKALGAKAKKNKS